MIIILSCSHLTSRSLQSLEPSKTLPPPSFCGKLTRPPLQSMRNSLLHRLSLSGIGACSGYAEASDSAQPSPGSSFDTFSNSRDAHQTRLCCLSSGSICIPDLPSSFSFSRRPFWPFDTPALGSSIAPYAAGFSEKIFHNASIGSPPLHFLLSRENAIT